MSNLGGDPQDSHLAMISRLKQIEIQFGLYNSQVSEEQHSQENLKLIRGVKDAMAEEIIKFKQAL